MQPGWILWIRRGRGVLWLVLGIPLIVTWLMAGGRAIAEWALEGAEVGIGGYYAFLLFQQAVASGVLFLFYDRHRITVLWTSHARDSIRIAVHGLAYFLAPLAYQMLFCLAWGWAKRDNLSQLVHYARVIDPIVIVFYLCSALLEEYVFRGIVLKRLCEHLSWGWATCACSVGFVLIHCWNRTDIHDEADLFLMSVLYCLVYKISGRSLVAAACLHAGNNLRIDILDGSELTIPRYGSYLRWFFGSNYALQTQDLILWEYLVWICLLIALILYDRSTAARDESIRE